MWCPSVKNIRIFQISQQSWSGFGSACRLPIRVFLYNIELSTIHIFSLICEILRLKLDCFHKMKDPSAQESWEGSPPHPLSLEGDTSVSLSPPPLILSFLKAKRQMLKHKDSRLIPLKYTSSHKTEQWNELCPFSLAFH